MKERRWRLFSVYVLVFLVSVALIVKSRTPSARKGAAFLRYTAGSLMVKLEKSDGYDGVYRIFDTDSGLVAKKMTQASVLTSVQNFAGSDGIYNADHLLELHQGSLKSLSAVDLMLLGVPLDAAAMTAADWESLPGIGPLLTKKIMEYSQKNGGFSSLDELNVVPGVGAGRIERLRRFFR